MGQILHGSATTTHAIRTKIQGSKESVHCLGKRYGIKDEEGVGTIPSPAASPARGEAK